MGIMRRQIILRTRLLLINRNHIQEYSLKGVPENDWEFNNEVLLRWINVVIIDHSREEKQYLMINTLQSIISAFYLSSELSILQSAGMQIASKSSTSLNLLHSAFVDESRYYLIDSPSLFDSSFCLNIWEEWSRIEIKSRFVYPFLEIELQNNKRSLQAKWKTIHRRTWIKYWDNWWGDICLRKITLFFVLRTKLVWLHNYLGLEKTKYSSRYYFVSEDSYS